MNSAQPDRDDRPGRREARGGRPQRQQRHELADQPGDELQVAVIGDEQVPRALQRLDEEDPVVLGVHAVPGRDAADAGQQHDRPRRRQPRPGETPTRATARARRPRSPAPAPAPAGRDRRAPRERSRRDPRGGNAAAGLQASLTLPMPGPRDGELSARHTRGPRRSRHRIRNLPHLRSRPNSSPAPAPPHLITARGG